MFLYNLMIVQEQRKNKSKTKMYQQQTFANSKTKMYQQQTFANSLIQPSEDANNKQRLRFIEC